jgi:hypothetical protein
LKVAPAEEGDPPPEDPPPDDPPAQPCLKVAEPPDEVGPCLEVEPDPGPCLDVAEPPTKADPIPEPAVGPCLKVASPKDRRGPKGKTKSEGGMAGAGKTRAEVLERLRHTLPPDVADRLIGDEDA